MVHKKYEINIKADTVNLKLEKLLDLFSINDVSFFSVEEIELPELKNK